MGATVGDLVGGLRSLAEELGDPDAPGAGRRAVADDLAMWPALASATVRALDLSPLPPKWHDDHASLRAVLGRIAAGEADPQRPSAPDPAQGTPRLAAMAVRIGLIADLLVGLPATRSSWEESSAVLLLAGVLAPVHSAARSSLHLLDRNHDSSAAWLLQRVATHTEGLSRLSGSVHGGRYAELFSPAPGEGSLDAALVTWRTETRRVLASQRCVTGLSLQTAAGDVMILTAAAAHAVNAMVSLGRVDPTEGQLAISWLADANAAWRGPARWPTSVRLDGVRTLAHEQASRTLRQRISEVLRDGREWAAPETIQRRVDPEGLLATMRRALRAGTSVAAAHERAIGNLVQGAGQLWVPALALTPPHRVGPEVFQARNRRRWIPMPAGEAQGLELLRLAQTATLLTSSSHHLLDRLAPIGRGLTRDPGGDIAAVVSAPGGEERGGPLWETVPDRKRPAPAREPVASSHPPRTLTAPSR